MPQTIDVTGLSPEAARTVQTLVDLLRAKDRIGAAEQQTAVTPPSQLGRDVWLARWDEWVASHPPSEVVADDSRESIYEGRGE